ncbi:hypothetical protein HMI55_001181 [Coelomomyces lativittatus]|nr:hypothetical protein HMI55_001181 [Coelomomyces lativittatus]
MMNMMELSPVNQSSALLAAFLESSSTISKDSSSSLSNSENTKIPPSTNISSTTNKFTLKVSPQASNPDLSSATFRETSIQTPLPTVPPPFREVPLSTTSNPKYSFFSSIYSPINPNEEILLKSELQSPVKINNTFYPEAIPTSEMIEEEIEEEILESE